MLTKFLITVLGLLLASCSTAEDSSSTRSAPPDTTPYSRPLVTDELSPQSVPAIPPEIKTPLKAPPSNKESQSIRSAPPDTTNYKRPVIREDRVPRNESVIPEN
jgi:hypothetical protein